MEKIVSFLSYWQTLVGAVIGGVIALLAALIVARSASRREERAAAMILIADLVSFRVANESLEENIQKQNITSERQPIWIASQLVSTRPNLSYLYESSMVRVMHVHTYLAAHLSLLKTIYNHLEIKIQRFQRNMETISDKSSKSELESIGKDAQVIAEWFKMLGEHASCAERLLSDIFLSQFSTFHKVKGLISPSSEERKCRDILERGKSLE